MRKELSQALTNDLSKDDFSNYVFELLLIEREIDHSIAELKKWMKEECVDTPMFVGPGNSYIRPEPLGVVAILGSWNFPMSTSLGPMVSAMAAGNAVILKPSEMSPFSAKAIKSLFARHLDLNAYQCVNGQV